MWPEHAVELMRLLPNGRLVILPGRHGEFLGEASFPPSDSKVPGLFVSVVDDFLGSQDPRK